MGVRAIHSAERLIAHQLGHPHGRLSGVVGAALNRSNRALISAAVDALALGPGATGVDIGFGGGVGLDLLLDRIGVDGHVHGVEVSSEMISRASRRYRDEIDRERLTLHHAAMDDLPLVESSVAGLITINTIYFVDDLAIAAAALSRVLNQEGRAVIGIRDPEQMLRMPVTRHGFRLRPVNEVVDAITAGGLELVEHRPIGSGRLVSHLLIARSG